MVQHTNQSDNPLENVEWNNLTPNQLMAISVKSTIEVNERISETQEQVAKVIVKVDKTHDMVQKTMINQNHIQSDVDEVKGDYRDLRDHVDEQIEKVHTRIDKNVEDTAVKKSQLNLVKWVAALATTAALTWYLSDYLPKRGEASNIDRLIILMEKMVEEE